MPIPSTIEKCGEQLRSHRSRDERKFRDLIAAFVSGSAEEDAGRWPDAPLRYDLPMSYRMFEITVARGSAFAHLAPLPFNMQERIERFSGYSSDQDFVLRLLCYAEKWAASDMRLSSDGQATKWDFLIKGEWKPAGVPSPPQRLWSFMVQGAMSLLELPDWLPDNCEGVIQSDVLKAGWLFHSSDVNRELHFTQYNAPETNRSSH